MPGRKVEKIHNQKLNMFDHDLTWENQSMQM